QSFFAERFFALFDSEGKGSLSLAELLRSLRGLLQGSETEKLVPLLRVYDVDAGVPEHPLRCPPPGSGSIDPDELRVVLGWCLRESSLDLSPQRLGDLTRSLFEAADKDRSGSITFEELREELEAFPEVMENLTISAASWLKPPGPPVPPPRPRILTRGFWQNRAGSLGCLGAFAALNLLLFTTGALQHPGWVALARGCGQCLNFNCAFLAVLMLRRCLTWLRTTPLAQLLPLDQHVGLHQLVGYLVLVLGATHTGAHLANVSRMVEQDGDRDKLGGLARYLLSSGAGAGGLGDTAPQTGLALQGLLVTMLIFSSPCVRSRGHFELFYWTHLSYISIWTLLLFHGPHFWKWFLVPGSLFTLEKVLGLAWRRAGGLHIVEVNLLPSQVTHLVIQRPPGFHYKPGDYIYLNIPAIASYEWHPFTISSAPEQPETLWLHIRSLGQWTHKLYQYFQQPQLPNPEPKPLRKILGERRQRRWVQVGAGCSPGMDGTHRICSVQCFIDGPYGTPTRRIFSSEHAVLIGAGIGITPFASILQSIMYRYQRRKQNCPSCHYSWCEDLQDGEMMLRKVDFIWINRDQKHFEWFVSLLTKLELEQAEEEPGGRFLEMHLYMTSALGRNDMKAIGLQVALDLLAAKEQRDSITGLRTRTQPGRPDWSKVFGKVAEEKRGKVQVFFCGSPALAKVIRGHCEHFGFQFFKENF
ncbi:NADPH oxidase 5, partial [Calypte anna]